MEYVPAPVVWPTEGAAVVDVPGEGSEQVGDTVVSVAPPAEDGEGPVGEEPAAARGAVDRTGAAEGDEEPPVVPERVRVDVFGPASAAQYGGFGVGFEVTPAAGSGAAGEGAAAAGSAGGPVALGEEEVGVVLDVSGFGHAFGGNGLHRLQVAQVPECVVQAAAEGVEPGADCRSALVPLPTSLDAVAKTLTVDVPVGGGGDESAEPGGRASGKEEAAEGELVAESGDSGQAASAGDGGEASSSQASGTFVVMAASGGATGTYGATPLTVAGSWKVSPGMGSFDYSLPLPAAAPITGAAPELALNYSSGSVDGLTSGDHAQVSQVGVGWSLTEAYVEQRFAACDGTWSDLCYKGDFYRIVLNGHASDLVEDKAAAAGGVRYFRLQDDPNWKVELRTGKSNGDEEGEYWRVSTPDGTQYTFGDGSATTPGEAATNSVWTVPVFARYSQYPCYQSGVTYPWCNQAWRWNLDLEQDVNGNRIWYHYQKETNRYGTLWGGTDRSYDRGGYLDYVDYSTTNTQQAKSRVNLVWEDRCTQRADGSVDPGGSCPAVSKANAASYPDVPVDLICSATQDCTEDSPSFFSTKVLRGVDTQRWNGTVFNLVDRVRMGYIFPANTDGTSPDLTLRRLQHSSGGVSLPEVFLHYTELPNRVDADPSLGVPELDKWRLKRVTDELGAQTTVAYGHPSTNRDCSPLPAQWDTNTQDCFPRFWKPDGASSGGFGAFFKYVTLSVTEVNEFRVGTDPTGGNRTKTTGSANTTTRYSYQDVPGAAQDNEPTALASLAVQSYGDWRGYSKVKVEVLSDPAYQATAEAKVLSATEYRVFRGLYGTKLTDGTTRTDTVESFITTPANDYYYLAGKVRDEQATDVDTHDMLSGTYYNYRQEDVLDSGTGTPNPALNDASVVLGYRAVERLGLPGGGKTSKTTIRTYDSNHRVVSESSSGTDVDSSCVTTGYAGDAAARAAHKLDYVASSELWTGECDSTGAPSGSLSRDQLFYYDGATTEFGQPIVEANLTQSRDQINIGSSAHADTYYSYDGAGRVVSTKDPNGNITTTTYSAIDATTHTVTVTNPKGQVSTTTLDWRRLIPQTVTDPNGNVTSLGYDGLGRLTTVAQPGDSSGSPTVKYTYGLDLGKVQPPKITTETKTPGAAGGYLSQVDYYDAFAQHRQSQTQAADGSSKTVVVASKYDELGNQTALTAPMTSTATLGAGPIQMDRNDVQETRTVYDPLGRPTLSMYWSTTSQQWRTTTTYTGLTTTTTPPAGGVPTTVTTDFDGRLLTRTEGAGTLTASTSYTYDDQDRLTSLTYPDGKQATYGYDALGRRTTTTDPDTGTTTTSYDDNGNPLTTTRASGQAVTTAYDKLNRPTTITGTPAGVSTPVTLATYTYDTATLGVGLPAASTTHTPTGAFTTAVTGYTSKGQPTGTTYTYPTPGTGTPTTHTYTTSYDAAGRPLATALPAVPGLPAETLNYGYNPTGQPTTMTGAAPYVSGTGYTPDGTIASRVIGSPTTGSSLASTYTWDTATRRLATTRTTTALNGSTPTPIVDDTYTFNDAGNITKITDTLPTADVATCHTYDGLNRLTHSWTTTATSCTDTDTGAAGTGGYNTRWAYDSAGDITSINRQGTTTTYSTTATTHPHAVTKTTNPTTTTTYTYDTDGRQTSKTATTGATTNTTDYTWDLLGHLTTSTTTTGAGAPATTSLAHAPDGTRLSRTTGDGATTIYLPDTEITYPTTGTPTSTRYYTHNGHTTAIRTSTGLTYQTSDRQGSTQTQLPDGTTTPTRIHTDPYGQPTAGTPATDRSFLGKTTDPTTGLTQLGHRYYDTTLAKFLTPDPLTDTRTTQTPNPYTYAANNPVSYSDPTGLSYVRDDSGGAGNPFAALMSGIKKITSGYHKSRSYSSAPSRHTSSSQPRSVYKPKVLRVGSGAGTKTVKVPTGLGPGWPCLCGAEAAVGYVMAFGGSGPGMASAAKTAAGVASGCSGLDMSCVVLGGASFFGGRLAAAALERLGGWSSRLLHRSEEAANTAKPFSRFVVNSAGETTMYLRAGNQGLEVTEHASQRMTQRGISIDAAESALKQEPFQYFHQDVWKTGYYDPTGRLFVGTVDGRVTTLINNASPNYIANLQAGTP